LDNNIYFYNSIYLYSSYHKKAEKELKKKGIIPPGEFEKGSLSCSDCAEIFRSCTAIEPYYPFYTAERLYQLKNTSWVEPEDTELLWAFHSVKKICRDLPKIKTWYKIFILGSV